MKKIPIVKIDLYYDGEYFSELEFQHKNRTYYLFLETEDYILPYNKTWTEDQLINPDMENVIPIMSEDLYTFKSKQIGYAVYEDGKYKQEIMI